MTDETPVVFPIDCPACAAPAGAPFSVTALDHTNLLIRVRCRSCQHEWALAQASVIEFGRKPDRRKEPGNTEGQAQTRRLCYCCRQPLTVIRRRRSTGFAPAEPGAAEFEEFLECTDASCIAMRLRRPPIPQPAMTK